MLNKIKELEKEIKKLNKVIKYMNHFMPEGMEDTAKILLEEENNG